MYNMMTFTKGHKINVGRKASEEKKEKISSATKGRVQGKKVMAVLKARTGKNNPMFGRKHTDKAKQIVRESKLEEKNPNWKGDNCVSKNKYHEFVRARKPKSDICEFCWKKKPLQLANMKNHVYTRKIEDYKWLCSKCHNDYDKRGKR